MRVLQGLCGGCIMPVGTALVASVAGDRLGRMMSLMGVPMLIAPIVGPILGGWLVEAASWHWVFLINVPFGAVAALTQVGAHTSPWYLGGVLMAQGLGIGGTMMPVSTAALQAVPRPTAVRGGDTRRSYAVS